MSNKNLYKLFLTADNGITTDTRSCGSGMIFFALKGDRFDGNRYAKEAIKAGCIAAVVDDSTLDGEQGMFVVEDVLLALQNLAWDFRRTLDIPVVGLTGSNGKTTTKELITAVLSNNYRVHSTVGNFNNHIGVPLTILSTPPNTDILIVEMGANHAGEIADLCVIAEPNYGLITNIGRAHLEGFGNIEGVKRAKGELFDFLRDNRGIGFVNSDHKVLTDISEGLETIKYHNYVSFHIGDIREFSWKVRDYNSPMLSIQLEGDYNKDNISAAIAMGLHFDVSEKNIGKAISEYTPKNNRSQTITTDDNTVLLDAYNANPTSMTVALQSFAINGTSNKLVILGDMRELGEYSSNAHKEIINLCTALDLDGIYVGKDFTKVSNDSDVVFESVEQLIKFLGLNKISSKTILLKGSRGMEMERLLPLL